MHSLNYLHFKCEDYYLNFYIPRFGYFDCLDCRTIDCPNSYLHILIDGLNRSCLQINFQFDRLQTSFALILDYGYALMRANKVIRLQKRFDEVIVL